MSFIKVYQRQQDEITIETNIFNSEDLLVGLSGLMDEFNNVQKYRPVLSLVFYYAANLFHIVAAKTYPEKSPIVSVGPFMPEDGVLLVTYTHEEEPTP